MGIQAWPFIQTGSSGAPAVTARQWRQMMVAPFVAMGSAARPLGAKSGIRVGTPSSVVTITGTGPYGWSANGFAGIIDGEANAAAGPYGYSVDTAQTGSIAAAGAAARVDRLDQVISDSDEGDGSGTKSMTTVYTQGAATGGLPPAAPARSHRLVLINVPTSGAPTITWAPDWSSDPGEWVFNTKAELDAYTTLIGSTNVPPFQSATVISDSTKVNNVTWFWHSGLTTPAWVGAWQDWSTVWSCAGSAPSLGNGTLTARYRWVDEHTVALRISLTFGSTSTGGTLGWAFTLPPGITTAAAGEQVLLVKAFTAGGLNWVGTAPVTAGATSSFNLAPYLPASASISNVQPVQNATSGGAGTGIPAIPGQYTFVNGSNLDISGMLEVA